MRRINEYKQNLEEFKTFASESTLSAPEQNMMLDEVNKETEIMMLCDLTDAICEIAKSMEGIKAEISQIRRQMGK